MSDPGSFDVVVIGAGPSGSLSAYHLARAGCNVALVDAKAFPREKPCGGGIQVRAVRRLPDGWRRVVRSELNRVSFTYGLERPFLRHSNEPLVYGVLRSEFDQFLLDAAVSAGAHFFGGSRVNCVESGRRSHVLARTQRVLFSAPFVIGADGANSVVGQVLTPRDSFFWQAALYSEIPLESCWRVPEDPCAMRIDWGSIPGGYGWVFPKSGSANIGVGGPAAIGRLLRPYLNRFLASVGLLESGTGDAVEFTGHQLPTLTRRTRLSGKNILLVGDAAGLVEPFTGDGISYACHSAEIAATWVLKALGGEDVRPEDYAKAIWREIGREITWSRKLLAYGIAFPRTIYRTLREKEPVWRKFCQVLQGEANFYELRELVLGKLSALSGPLQLVADGCERVRVAYAGQTLT